MMTKKKFAWDVFDSSAFWPAWCTICSSKRWVCRPLNFHSHWYSPRIANLGCSRSRPAWNTLVRRGPLALSSPGMWQYPLVSRGFEYNDCGRPALSSHLAQLPWQPAWTFASSHWLDDRSSFAGHRWWYSPRSWQLSYSAFRSSCCDWRAAESKPTTVCPWYCLVSSTLFWAVNEIDSSILCPTGFSRAHSEAAVD